MLLYNIADLENTMEKIILGNRYELLEMIAEGGMSKVYRAYCNTLNRIVAVKILKNEFSKDEEFLIKFNNEAKAAASLNHPNIINVYDVGQEKDIAYIVMEYVDGINLKQLINKKGTLTEKEALNIIKQISLALKEAHKNKIIHRDIKPHNIMINKDNVVKVGDFGIAKATTSATITTLNNVIGSVHYFSPEQARGGYMDERSDIYSLGVMLYELLIGKPPYEGDTPINIAIKHIHDNIEIPDSYKKKLSSSIQNMIMKMTQKNMDKRYAKVEDIINDIDKIQDGNWNINYFDNADEDEYGTKVIKISQEQIEQSGKKMNGEEKKKKLVKTLFTLATVVVVLGIVVGFLVNSGGDILDAISSRNNTVIPDVKGKSVIEGQRELEQNSLTLKIMSEKEDPDNEPGTILDQNPEAGLKIRKGEEISVIISKAPDNTVITPDVLDRDIKEAEKILTEAKLQVNIEEVFDENIAKGKVVSQLPGPDIKSKIGDVIKLKVSKGKEIIQEKVPYYIGMSIDDVRKNIGNFQIGNVWNGEDTSKKEGVVLSQTPQGGTMYDIGKKIDFVINKLPEKEEPKPNVNDTVTQVPTTKTITLGLPQKESLLLSVMDKSDGKVVYTTTISTLENQNVEVTLSAYMGQIKNYDIYINGEYYATTGAVTFN